MKDKVRKHQPIENTAYARAIAEIRRSGASGIHQDKRTRRARTRQAQLGQAIRNQGE